MYNLVDILKTILNDLTDNPQNINIIDDQHLIDKLSGVEFHLYDDYFQMTRGDDKPISQSSFSDNEQAIIMEIKKMITDPEVTKDKQENYQKYITENRQRFSDWFRNPVPVTSGVVEEDDAEEYVR